MKNTLYALLIAFVFVLFVMPKGWGQTPCLPGGIIFTTQEEIDDFPLNYPGCTEIEGEVRILGPQIYNLLGLSQIKKIQGNLNIDSTDITDLYGLHEIRSIGGDFILLRNNNIESLVGLSTIDSILGEFLIVFNNKLITTAGIENLKFVFRIFISELPELLNIDGFENVKTVYTVTILRNSNLLNIDGFPKVNTIPGSIEIWQNESLANVNGLDSLRYSGRLNLHHLQSLTNLEGLAKLEKVSGSFSFENLPLLDSFPFFTNMETVEGGLSFQNLPLISHFNGFRHLKNVKGSISFHFLNSLIGINGFENLKSVDGIFLRDNSNLEEIGGLETIEKLNNGRITVLDNNKLKNLNGFSNLDSCSHSIKIENNEGLEDIYGIENMYIGEEILFIKILNNPNLSLCSLSNICHILPKIEAIDISNNKIGCNYYDILIFCGGRLVHTSLRLDVDEECLTGNVIESQNPLYAQFIQNEKKITSQFNSGVINFGYFSLTPIELKISGFNNKLWATCNNPLLFDPTQYGDTIYADFLIQPLDDCPELNVDLNLPPVFRGCLVTTDMRVRTQNTGTVPAENVQLAVVLPFDLMEVDAAIPPSTSQNGDTLFFALGDLDIFEVAEVNLTVRTRCDTFLLDHTICIEAFAEMDNPCPPDEPVGSLIQTTATCLPNDIVRFTLTNIGDEPTTTPHHYFIIEDIVVLMSDEFDLDVLESIHIDVDATGSTYRMEATKLPDGTLTAAALEGCGGFTPGMINVFWLDEGFSHYDIGCRQVILAYDPNDKQAIPTGVGPEHLLAANRPIEYTIRFQNTGTDTAYRVLLTDILPPEMDVTTFRPGYASHDYTWEIRGLDTLEVLFFPIALPDSAASQEGSQGFFTFSMDQQPDLPDGSLIQNTASIVFDFNPPIVTNTVFHTIGKLTVSIDHPQPQAGLWQLLGNPMGDQAIFRSTLAIPGVKRFELYDLMGHEVRQEVFYGEEYLFQRGILRSGMYVFRLIDEQGRQFTGKIVLAE